VSRTITVYSFNELSDKAKEKAIEESRYRYTERVYYWSENICDEWKEEKFPEKGYEVDKIYFTGFSNQGDGACFTGGVDVLKWLEEKDGPIPTRDTRSLRFWLKRLGSAAAFVHISHYGHSYHKYSMQFNFEWNEYPEPPKAICQLEKLEKQIMEDARDLAEKLYRELEAEYWNLSSDEYISEGLSTDDDIFFLEDGRPFEE
jgi:hypothetical protein